MPKVIKGEILTPYIPAEFPEVFKQSLETIQWVNIDVKMSALFDQSPLLFSQLRNCVWAILMQVNLWFKN